MGWIVATSTNYTSSTTSVDPWQGWATNITTAATDVWVEWNNATDCNTDQVWVRWVDGVRDQTIITRGRRRGMTDEQWAQYEADRRAEQERYEAQIKKEREARKEAERKAEEILLAHLSFAQREEYQKKGYFLVYLPNGRIYRIKKARHGNVELVEPDEQGRLVRVENLCVHPSVQCPDQDTMLAQKLILEANEDHLRQVANISDYRRARERAREAPHRRVG